MEADLAKKLQEIQARGKDVSGVLLVDKMGLPIEA